ncbi:MAG: hypothetical protein KDC71_24895, partial [Acidobacteria bacterium]|nr:hypothetical protein [Acidobacteriota bacterium]
PDTAVRNDLVLGKKIIPRLDISKNPGLEVYNSKGFLHVAGWFNLIQKDVVPLIFNCAEDYIFSVFPGASRVGPNGGFLMVRAQVPILEVSSEFGRGFQRRFLGVLRP